MIETKVKIAVDPDRLRSGTRSEQFNKTIGEGAIAASYSADRIGMGEKIRQPFIHEGEVWVCVGRRGRGPTAEAYRLVLIDWYSAQHHAALRPAAIPARVFSGVRDTILTFWDPPTRSLP